MRDINFGDISARIEFKPDFLFSKNTTYGLGGGCKGAFYPKSEEEAVAVFCYLLENKERFIVLGNGSNVLASDKFYDGYVICTCNLKGITRAATDRISCLGGTTVGELLSYCKDEGLSGLEYLYGIPATVGGLVFMNGGAGGRSIGDNVEGVAVFDGKLRNFTQKSCNFGHKYSTMRDINCIILSISLKVIQSDCGTVERNIKKYSRLRSRQPKGKSCGCVFKNPPYISAGKLIDGCNLKGLKFGGAKVSREHANFIINENGTSYDVYGLLKAVQYEVYKKTGILLEEEVVYIGDFNDT